MREKSEMIMIKKKREKSWLGIIEWGKGEIDREKKMRERREIEGEIIERRSDCEEEK